MPKNLTDAIEFDTVSVPVDTDTADGASVETTFQTLTDRTRYLIDMILSMRVSNWLQSDVSSITAGTFCNGANVMAICYDAAEDRFYAIDDDGAVVMTIPPNFSSTPTTPGGGPHLWYDHTSDPLDNTLWTASGGMVGIAANNGTVVGVSASTSGQVARATRFGAFSAQTPAESASWGTVSYDPGCGLFFIGGAGGGVPAHVETSPDGSTWTSRSTASGFSVNGVGPAAIASDPAGVGGTMIITQTEYSHTTNGTSYTYGTHGLGSSPKALTYSDGRWIAVLTNGDIAYSDDDGDNWTTVTTPLDDFVSTYVHIAADGLGGVVASASGSGDSFLWASSDNGLTWDTVYQQSMSDAMESGPCYGGGHFAAIGCPSGGTVAAMHTMRVMEI